MIDLLAFEPHFARHLAPVWDALPEKGTAYLEPSFAHTIPGAVPYRPDRSLLPKPDPSRRALVASYGDTKVGRRMGYGSFAFLEHGCGQAYSGPRQGHGSYAGGIDRDDTGLFLCPNDYSANLWRKAYPGAAVEIVGSPSLDSLPARQSGAGPVVAISFHWRCRVAPETMPAIDHFGGVLPTLARRYTVIGHGHPRIIDDLARWYGRLGIETVRDFDDVCRRADLYICDNSSTLYQFAATGRPVVVLNAPFYRRNVHHGLRFWDAANVGVQVDEPGDLIAAVERALECRQGDVEAREAALRIAFAHRSGGAQRAADALLRWLAPVAVAA